MPFVPVEEAKYNPAVKAYVKSVGSGVIDGNGEQAWAAALFFRDAVNAVVKDGGVNSLTRANFLKAAGGIHSFDADGMLGHQRHPGQEGDAVHVAVPGEGREVRAGVPQEAGDVRLQPQERRDRAAVRRLTGRPTMSDELAGKVALVTGASKNIGKGIALEVGASGAVTYLTARSVEDVPGQLASLNRTVAEIEARGGTAVAVACDHTDDAQVEAVFDRIRAEQGRLDLVVNVASPDFSEMVGVSFWDLPFRHISACLDIGPRSNYVTTALAARMMIEQGSGVVVNISSHGAESYLLSVPYGVGKAAIDKVTRDTAFELQPHGVAVVSLWPGLVLTEGLLANTVLTDDGRRELHGLDVSFGETPKFNGLAVVALAVGPEHPRAHRRLVLVGVARPRVRLHRGRRSPPTRDGQQRPHRDGRRHARLLARRRTRRALRPVVAT